jgi:hypothetical protein
MSGISKAAGVGTRGDKTVCFVLDPEAGMASVKVKLL